MIEKTKDVPTTDIAPSPGGSGLVSVTGRPGYGVYNVNFPHMDQRDQAQCTSQAV